jgi:uncharacterized protein
MTDSFGVGRRSLLRGAAAVAGAAAFVPFEALAARTSGAGPVVKATFSPDYGPLRPTRDHTTGLELLMLPKGFEYISHSWRGDPLADGTPTPGAHDGMGAFRRGDWVTLVRNHEIGSYAGKFTDPAYDPDGSGGTTNLVFDPHAGEFVDSWPSLSGTVVNCAGGKTPWGSWLTCEEVGDLPEGINPRSGIRHGYVFEVPADGRGDPTPFKAMGRFSHEAVVIDPATGFVYLTQDFLRVNTEVQPIVIEPASGLYRFTPNQPDNLAAGGQLEMMVIHHGQTGSYNTSKDPTGTTYEGTSWVTIDDPDPDPDQPDPAAQGKAKGAAIFNRLEGITFADGLIYIVATEGGPVVPGRVAGGGQIFEYNSATGDMRVLFASPSLEVLKNPDNITVSQRGGLVLCEDSVGSPMYLQGLTQDGQLFRFAANNVVVPPNGIPGKPSIPPGDYRGDEWTGATYDPKNGNWLFVNVQTPGITFAITGPWRNGVL